MVMMRGVCVRAVFACVLFCVVGACATVLLDESSFRVFEKAAEPQPWPLTRVMSGRVEVLESTPNAHVFELLDNEDENTPEMQELLKDVGKKYVLQVDDADGSVSYVPLSFDLFEGGCPDEVEEKGLVELVMVEVRADDPENTVLAVGFGDPKEELVEPQEEALYTAQPQGSTVFTALFILLNFDDEQHACSSVDGGIYGLIYNGTYNIRDNYLAFSKGRASMPMPSDFSATVAGPYTITPDSTSCHSYTSHRSAARSAAAADGYNLNDFSTVVTIPPKDTSCSWAGRATLFNCPSYSGGICNMHALRCEAFVISHECGHNLALEHSAHDSNDDEVLPSTIYQYRDHSCLMGNRNSWGVLNAVKLWKKGWIDADKVIETSDPGAFTLSSLDLPYDEPESIPYAQMVVYKDRESPHKEYFLSFRSRLGYAYNLQSTYTGGANVHYYINSKWSYYVKTLTSSSPTHTTTHSQFTLKYGSHDETGGTVYIIPPDCEDNGADCPYRWDVGAFGGCDCSALERTRTVVCRTGQGTGSVAADGFCVADNDFVKPVTTEACSCDGTTFEWRVDDWGDCSETCGDGVQTRSATCYVTGTETTAADGNCDAGSKPSESRTCNLGSCPAPTYEWRTGDWGDCSKSCGTGSQTRSVTCYNADTDQAVADGNCDAGAEPTGFQTCNTQACPTTYEWRTTDWGDCSASCGGGTQTRSVTCYNANTDQAVADGNCDEGAEPSQTQSCNTQACGATYEWRYDDWGECSASCGGGTQSRTASCYNADTDQLAASSSCDGVAQESLSQSCNTQACGVTYEWRYGDWGECSASCGGGTQSRTATCYNADTDQLANPSSCPSQHDSLSQSCNTQACGVTYEWRYGDWGECSASCGGGTQSRTATCYNADTDQLANPSSCPSQHDSLSQSCNTQACGGVTYEWRYDDWGECSASCGGGTQSRTASCYNADTDQPAASSSCDGVAQEGLSQSCNTQNCPVFEWRYGDWGECSASCGGGTQTRTATCVNAETEQAASVSFCANVQQDSVSQACNTQSCPTETTYEWHYGDWGDCSASCGGGTQSRSATCHNADTQLLVSSSSCANVQQDSLSRSCNTDACEEYEWRYSDWSLCSADCDGGQQTRTVTCWVIGTSTQRSASFCQYLERDSLERECNTQSCDPCSAIDCGDHGSCSGGECTCTDGYVGDHCQTAPAIGAVYVEYADDVETEQYEVDWQSSGTVSRVNLFLVEVKNGEYGLAFPIARNISNSHHHTFTIQDVFRGSGTFSVQVMSTPSISNHSASFEVDTCEYISCGSHGSCTDGACSCTDGYTGATCQTAPPDPCDSYSCYHSGECSVDDDNNAYCNCSQTVHSATNLPYEGERCNNIPECDIVCANGGLPPSDCSGVEPCSCSSPWAGDRCESCTFECYSGAAAASCDECVCEGNFMGAHCELQFRTFEIGPFDMDYANVDSAAERESFFTLFVTDVATFLGIAESRVIARSVRRGVYVSFSLVGTEPQSWSDRRKMRFNTQSAEEDAAVLEQLNAWMVEIKTAIESRHVGLFSGSVMQHLAPDASVAPSSSSDSSSSSSPIALIVGALVGALVVSLVVVYVVRRRGRSSRTSSGVPAKMNSLVLGEVSMGALETGEQPGAIGQFGEQPWAPQRYGQQQEEQQEQQQEEQQQQDEYYGEQPHYDEQYGEQYEAAATRAPPPPPQNALPHPWVTYTTEDGVPYFYNPVSEVSVWTIEEVRQQAGY